MGVDYYSCENCSESYCEDNLTYCCFCDKHLCNDCMDEKSWQYDKDNFDLDKNGKNIKPDNYNFISCNKIEQINK